MDNVFNILYVSNDENNAPKTIAKIEKHFHLLNVDIQFASDGSKALYCLHQENFHLIITDLDMPVMDGLTLIREVRKSDGGVGIILLVHKGQTIEESSVSTFTLPILDWSAFFNMIAGSIPEEIKSFYGFVERDEKTEALYAQIAEKLVTETGIVNKPADSPVVLIPRWFDEDENEEEENRSQTTSIQNKEVETKPPAASWIGQSLAEIIILIALGLTLVFLLTWQNEHFEVWMRQLSAIFIGLCFLSFFIGKTVERFVLNRKKD